MIYVINISYHQTFNSKQRISVKFMLMSKIIFSTTAIVFNSARKVSWHSDNLL